ncbi:MAG: hypothetical protein K2N30_00865, partial [Clostridia bacterium]|nr:hypothetical protein [Clostridia bacterium]
MIVVTSRKGFLITGFFVLLLGIGLIAGGIIYRNRTNAKLDSWTHVNAVVVGYEVSYKTDSEGYRESVFYATVEDFVDKTYRTTGGTGSSIAPAKGTY